MCMVESTLIQVCCTSRTQSCELDLHVVVNHKNIIDLYACALAVYICCQPHVLYVRVLVHHPCMFVVKLPGKVP